MNHALWNLCHNGDGTTPADAYYDAFQKPRRTMTDAKSTPRKSRELGDVVHSALSKVGITPERVTEWLGEPCGCKERREKLNKLSRWAKGVLSGIFFQKPDGL